MRSNPVFLALFKKNKDHDQDHGLTSLQKCFFFFTMFNPHVTFYELNNLSFVIKNIIKQYFVAQYVEP